MLSFLMFPGRYGVYIKKTFMCDTVRNSDKTVQETPAALNKPQILDLSLM